MHISSENSSFMYINYEKSEMFGLAWAAPAAFPLPVSLLVSLAICLPLSFAVWRLLVVGTYTYSQFLIIFCTHNINVYLLGVLCMPWQPIHWQRKVPRSILWRDGGGDDADYSDFSIQ